MQLNFAVREADYMKADSLYRRLPPPRQDTLQYLTMQAFAKGDVARQEALYRAYEQDTTTTATWMSYQFLHAMENPDAAERFATLALKEVKTDQARARAALTMAFIEAERGQMRAAIARLNAGNFPNKRTMYAEFANVPLYRIPADVLAQMRADVERMDSVPKSTDGPEQVRPHVRLYRLALLSCRAGDYAAATSYAQRLRTLSAPTTYQKSVALLADEIDAQIDVENGRPQDAVRRLAAHKGTIALDIGAGLMWGAGPIVWHAEALFQSKRFEEAQRYFDNIDDALYVDGPHVSYILLRRAQIADARNDGATARDLYARFLKIFSRPDPEMKDVVDQARARLAALQQQAG